LILAGSARALKLRGRALLQVYDEEELHQLRVTLRRIRSALEPMPTEKARRLRHDLGELARATNSARDWDTLVVCAREELSAGQFDELQSTLVAARAVARDKVYRALHSRHWKKTLRRWKKYSRRSAPDDRDLSGALPNPEKTLVRSRRAVNKALSSDDEKHWHKLRIAIKALRYSLENRLELEPDVTAEQLVAACKRLQTGLGKWHDTVVHRRLLPQLVDDSDHPGQKLAGTTLLNTLDSKGQQCLQEIRLELQSAGGFNDLVEQALKPSP